MLHRRGASGLHKDQIGFTTDYLAGQAFSFVMTLDAVGPWPPIQESHVEMDGAWALYEAWVKLQIGDIDTALVYSYGKPSPGDCATCSSRQLDPYYLAPLWPDAWSPRRAAGPGAAARRWSITEADLAAVASAAAGSHSARPAEYRSVALPMAA
jgi:hypothetical protein